MNSSLYLECSSSNIDTLEKNAEKYKKKNCYILFMYSPEYLQPYQINWKKHAFLSLFLFLVIALLRKQGLVLQFHRPALTALVMLCMFQLLSQAGFFLSQRLQKRLQIDYPSLMLWLYPTLVLLQLATFSFVLVVSSNYFFGRGFWSNVLQLNGLETTRFFSTCFATMIVFTALHFVIATFSILKWIAGSSMARVEALNQQQQTDDDQLLHQQISTTINRIRNETDKIQLQRLKANRVNRLALIGLFLILVSGSCWIIFFRPAVVLYYRAEIQLRTFIEPMAAFATLKHLCEKYPNYRYMDSVKFRMAWILDRRLQRFDEAAESYRQFIDQYSKKSIWVDEAYVALVRLYFDKLGQPQQALVYAAEYLGRYPEGIFAPHMHLYRIRAFAQSNDIASAIEEKQKSLQRFSGKKIQIISNEDRLLEVISFDDAIKAEINAYPALQ